MTRASQSTSSEKSSADAVPITYAGIDVGSKELTLAVRIDRAALPAEKFKNDEKGHKAIYRRLAGFKRPIRVSMESTSHYHLPVALFLDEKEDMQVCVANPAEVKRFANVRLHSQKTDAIDAAAIARYSESEYFDPRPLPGRNAYELFLIGRRIDDVVKDRAREKCRLHAVKASGFKRSEAVKSAERNIACLTKEIVRLRKEAMKMIKEDKDGKGLLRKFSLLMTVKGFGEPTSIRLLCELSILPADMLAKQWVCIAGLDPKKKESSTKKWKTRISREGNAHLRRLLYMPALVAIQFTPEVSRFYNMLKDRGLSNMQAIVAVMRRFLHKVWGMFRNDQPYDPSKFYNFPVPPAIKTA